MSTIRHAVYQNISEKAQITPSNFSVLTLLPQSQRDLSLQIPINYVNGPGVALTPVCFARKRYADKQASRCFSNLLAVGFDRFVVDIFWDASRSLWSLCPVELGATPAASSTSSGASSSSSSASSAATGGVVRRGELVAQPELGLLNREASSSFAAASSQSVRSTGKGEAGSISTTTTLNGSPNASPTSAGELIDVGPYSCTTSINLPFLARILHAHLDTTQFRQNARIKYLILNVHAAAPAASPNGNANAPNAADLPNRKNLLSSILSSELSDYLYMPEDLRSERTDLNASSSWFGGDSSFDPDAAYFNINVDQSEGHSLTTNGWPSASFVEMENAQRLVIGYGKVAPQMDGYNFSGDSSTIFSHGTLQSNSPITTNGQGEIETGCFFKPNTHSLQSNNNNSWATSASSNGGDETSQNYFLTEAANMTYCGIAPILNDTLSDSTADQDFAPYENYVQRTIWSWANSEPRNNSGGDDDPHTNNRCAVLNSSSGFWQTENCAQEHYSACRKPNEIYKWAISETSATYAQANIPCIDGTLFTVPRTALENAYLLDKWRKTVSAQDLNDELLWLNFNDLDAKNCWVIGQNETCPYTPQKEGDRAVLVPTIAAIIVFVLAGLTVFVKCAANRQQSKSRRRRGDDGWDYEGVPS